MKYPISLTLFFPVYNEEENIQQLIEHTVRVVESSPYIRDHEILIINDGSTDNTAEISDQLAAQYPSVYAIHHAKNKGYGSALRTGIAEASKDYIFFTDADLQFDILELNNLIVHLEDYGDMVVGYRAPRRDPFMRRVNAWGWNVLNRVLFGLRIRDIDCAFKLFKRETVQSLRLRSRGAMINAEMLIRLQRQGVVVKEVPVTHLPRQRGSATGAKPSVILRALREMADLYRGDLGLATQKQALKFAGVGVLNTLIDMSLYVLLTRTFGLVASQFLLAKFLSFMAGTVSSLLLNRYWTFGLRTRITAAELARFYAMVSLSLVANLSAMYASVRVLGLPDVVGLFIATGVSLVASYTLSRFWVFRTDHRPSARLALPRAFMFLLIGTSVLVGMPGSVAHAKDHSNGEAPKHAAAAQPQPVEHASQTQDNSDPSDPVQPTPPTPVVSTPTMPSFPVASPPLFPYYTPPVQSVATSTTPAPVPAPVATTTPVTPAATKPPVAKTGAATSTVPARLTPTAGSNTGTPSALSSLKEALFPGSAYPNQHLSATTTRVLMLITGLFAASGVSFLVYGALAASASRRAAHRDFHRIPVAFR